jgi:hypothetical protein
VELGTSKPNKNQEENGNYKGLLMFKVGGMIRSPSKKTLDTKEGMQTAMRLLNGIPCSPLKDMLFTKSLCTLEDALKGVGHVYKFGSSFHKIKFDARRE